MSRSAAAQPKKGQLQAGDELLPGVDGAPKLFRRKVTRKVEMPFVRRVKVQVVTKRVLEDKGQTKVKVKQMVETADFEEVEEVYTEFQERRGQREKKIWEEKTVMEDYVKKEPVTKTRMVRKPCIKIEEVDDFQIVQVPSTKVIQQEGVRIDTVEDRKWVEEEAWEIVDLRPMATGQRIKGDTKVIENQDGPVEETRKIGTQLYHEDDLHKAHVDAHNLQEDRHAGESNAPLYGTSLPSAENDELKGDFAAAGGASGGPASRPSASSSAPRQAAPAPARQGGGGGQRKRGNRGGNDAASV